MTGRLGPRFAAEAAFIVLAAVAAGAAQLDPVGIVAVMAVAWLAVAAVELVASRQGGRATGEAGADELGAEQASALALEAPQQPGVGQAIQRLFKRRGSTGPLDDAMPLPPEAVEIPQHVRVLPQAAPVATTPMTVQPSTPAVATTPATRAAPPAPIPEAPSAPAPAAVSEPPGERLIQPPASPPVAAPLAEPLEPSAPATSDEPAPDERAVETLPPVAPEPTPQVATPATFEPSPPAPEPAAPERAPVESAPFAPPTLATAPEPPPAVAEPAPAPVAASSVVAFTPRDEGPREWNLWDLETRAREHAGEDPIRDEEWAYLLMYLREFANADGVLPVDFDGLVRESFADLIVAGRQ